MALVVILLSLTGTAILGEPWNNIGLVVQAIGWGEKNLESPLIDASIELMLDTVPGENPEAPPITIVAACGFRSDENIPKGTGIANGTIICKLLNEDGNAIAEGDVTITSYTAGDLVIIDINQPIFIGANHFVNVFNATVIVEAPL